jgi:glutamate synthase domain-containing protein 2
MQWVEILKGLGLRSLEELRGRTDLLRYAGGDLPWEVE